MDRKQEPLCLAEQVLANQDFTSILKSKTKDQLLFIERSSLEGDFI
jgi:hypothetical protein